jgi:hypothetical protein
VKEFHIVLISSTFTLLMRSNRATVKSFAIILLLLFCQKVGGGLYLHNWLHANACKQFNHAGVEVVTGYNCSCIDDFSMPFADNPETVYQPVPSIETEFVPSGNYFVPFSSKFFHSLRAPPFFS